MRRKRYFKKGFVRKYIGIPKGITKRYQDRIKYVSGICPIAEGIYLVSHSTAAFRTDRGKKEMMYQKTKLGWKPDNFCHEQSLVLDTDSGLVIFNSCSHGGVVNIINEVKAAFPEQKITALIGGFHIFRHPGSGNPGARKINKRNRNSVYLHRTLLEGKRIIEF